MPIENRKYPQKIDVYSYKRAHRYVSCSNGVSEGVVGQ